MASTVSNKNERSEKWQRPFQMATTVYERQIGFGEGDSLPNPVCVVTEPGAHTEPPCALSFIKSGLIRILHQYFTHSLYVYAGETIMPPRVRGQNPAGAKRFVSFMILPKKKAG